MNEALQQKLAAIQARADKAALQWMKEAEGDIESKVRGMLDRRLQEIVGKLMGFDNRWGPWEVDNCNGRAGESAAGEWLRSQAGEAVKTWLSEQAGNLPSLPKGAIKALQKSYTDRLLDDAEDLLKRKAQEDAEALVAGLMREGPLPDRGETRSGSMPKA